jgi:hypothetical protein
MKRRGLLRCQMTPIGRYWHKAEITNLAVASPITKIARVLPRRPAPCARAAAQKVDSAATTKLS